MQRKSKAERIEPPMSVQEMAAFIAQTSGELALLAGRAQWPLLTYFLNMARVEAEARLASVDGKPERRSTQRLSSVGRSSGV